MNETPPTPTNLDDALLARLPLFPLSDAVLFPGTIIPLHFFEARYRALAQACVEGNRLMVLGNLAVDADAEADASADQGGEDEIPRVRPVVTIGAVAAERRLPDGRWDIALRGVCRAEIIAELPSDEPYRLVQVRRLRDREKPADRLHGSDLRSAVMQLANLLPALWPQLSPLLAAVTTPASLTDVVSSMFVDDRNLRRRLLEELTVSARLDVLTDAVGEILLDLTFRTLGHDKRHAPLKN